MIGPLPPFFTIFRVDAIGGGGAGGGGGAPLGIGSTTATAARGPAPLAGNVSSSTASSSSAVSGSALSAASPSAPTSPGSSRLVFAPDCRSFDVVAARPAPRGDPSTDVLPSG